MGLLQREVQARSFLEHFSIRVIVVADNSRNLAKKRNIWDNKITHDDRDMMFVTINCDGIDGMLRGQQIL